MGPTLAWIYVEDIDKWFEGAVSPEGAMFQEKPEGVKAGSTIYAFAREEGEPMPTGIEAAAMLAQARLMAAGGIGRN